MNSTDTNLPIQENECEDNILLFDYSTKKKRKSKTTKLAAARAEPDILVNDTTESVPNYDYAFLLARVFENIVVKDKQDKLFPNASQVQNKHKITSVNNFEDIVKSIRIGNADGLTESKKHFANYLLSELSCGGYFSNSTLVLFGKFTGTRIDNVCLKYIDIHIRCVNCRGFNTTLFRNADVRKYAIECGCGSKRILPIVAEKNLENTRKLKN